MKRRFINGLHAFIPIPTGFTINKNIEAKKISPANAALALQMEFDDFNALLKGEAPLTERIAEGLVKLIGGRKEFWLGLEADYVAHPKFAGWGGSRTGSGRKKLGLTSKQIRLSAEPEQMTKIEAWLKKQKNASQAVAQLILEVSQRSEARGSQPSESRGKQKS
jgi:plasmid maintenance system antidote protein VapI